MKNVLVFLVAAGALSLALVASTGGEEAPNFTYVGVKKCKICHQKESDGAQFAIWESSKHSKAFETLASPKAAQYAQERGISGSPQEAPECLKCHVTAFGLTSEELEASGITLEEGISCESCHGPGAAYSKLKAMKGITSGELDGASLGLILPDEELCVTCHNEESPAYKEFDFETFCKAIAHPYPEATE